MEVWEEREKKGRVEDGRMEGRWEWKAESVTRGLPGKNERSWGGGERGGEAEEGVDRAKKSALMTINWGKKTGKADKGGCHRMALSQVLLRLLLVWRPLMRESRHTTCWLLCLQEDHTVWWGLVNQVCFIFKHLCHLSETSFCFVPVITSDWFVLCLHIDERSFWASYSNRSDTAVLSGGKQDKTTETLAFFGEKGCLREDIWNKNNTFFFFKLWKRRFYI